MIKLSYLLTLREWRQCVLKVLEKKSQRCKKAKPLNDFHYNQNNPDVHDGICEKCQAGINENNNQRGR